MNQFDYGDSGSKRTGSHILHFGFETSLFDDANSLFMFRPLGSCNPKFSSYVFVVSIFVVFAAALVALIAGSVWTDRHYSPST